MRKFFLQPLALGGKVAVGDARVLQCREDEEAFILAERNDTRRPVRQGIFGWSAVHVDDACARISVDAEEYFSLRRDDLIATVTDRIKFPTECRCPLRQVIDP